MRLAAVPAAKLAGKNPLAVLLVCEGRDPGLPAFKLAKRAGSLIRSKAWTAKAGKSLTLHAESADGPRCLVLIGMGEAKSIDTEALRRAGVEASKAAATQGVKKLVVGAASKVGLDTDGLAALGEGLVLADYRYQLKKAETTPPASVEVATSVRSASAVLKRAQAIAEGSNLARDLGDLPGNICDPNHLKRTAQKLSRTGKLRFKAYDKATLKRMGYGGILAVNQGSVTPPWLLEMEYKPAKPKRTICVVGKGLTFDSGGLSIKPAGGMEEMRYDMCGAAATLGLMQAIAATKPKDVRVIGLVGTTENMPDGGAYRPGDVVTTGSGITIEVINTDAEGRVVLADVLHHAKRFKPDLIVDMATLTGAVVVALGHEAAGLFCPDDKIAAQLHEAGERSGEKVWRLPTYKAYDEAVKSSWADVRNSAGRAAGSCTAAAFLARFTEGFTHAHLDIAGAAWEMKSRGGLPAGGTGFGVRLLHDFIQSWR